MRLFESMKIGRVPVIISDAWVAPAGPDWAQFSVRITEREIETIPRRLHELEPRYEAMGRAARVAWEQWFDRTVAFNTCVDYCLEIKRQQSVHKKIFQRMIVFKNSYGQLVRPFYFKYYFLKPLLRDLRVLALD